MCPLTPFNVLSSSKYLLTYLQYSIPSPPSYQFAQYFPNGGHPVHPHQSRNHRSHPDRHRHHDRTHPPQYPHDRGHRHAHVQPAHIQMHHAPQSRPRRSSTGDGPRIANFNINPALAYPSHSNSDPRYTHTRPILRNRAGSPLAPLVSHRIYPP